MDNSTKLEYNRHSYLESYKRGTDRDSLSTDPLEFDSITECIQLIYNINYTIPLVGMETCIARVPP